jgi:hypothetical protein
MTDFLAIKKVCEASSYLLEKTFDEFLMYYAADVAGLEKYMNKRMKPYRRIIHRELVRYEGLLKAQFIATMVFKEGGILRKLLNHSRVKNLAPDELSYLEFQLEHPWRYSFARVEEELGHDFYRMLDTITGATYLLYSPGITRTIRDDGRVVNLWMLMITFNGKCYQTQGVIAGLSSFTPGDMLFLATELQPDITETSQVYEVVERNPFPFMALLKYANTPILEQGDDIVSYHLADDELASFSPDIFGGATRMEWNEKVYRIWIPGLSDSMHLVRVYYDELEGLLMRFSATRTGWDLAREWLAGFGISLKGEPDYTVSPVMAMAFEDIIGYEPELDPYEILFTKPSSPESEKELERLNHAMGLLVPKINAGKPIDIKQISRETNVDADILQELVAELKKKIGK